MLTDSNTGDQTCFTCGHVVYPTPIPVVDPALRLERRPSHGGHSLG